MIFKVNDSLAPLTGLLIISHKQQAFAHNFDTAKSGLIAAANLKLRSDFITNLFQSLISHAHGDTNCSAR